MKIFFKSQNPLLSTLPYIYRDKAGEAYRTQKLQWLLIVYLLLLSYGGVIALLMQHNKMIISTVSELCIWFAPIIITTPIFFISWPLAYVHGKNSVHSVVKYLESMIKDYNKISDIMKSKITIIQGRPIYKEGDWEKISIEEQRNCLKENFKHLLDGKGITKKKEQHLIDVFLDLLNQDTIVLGQIPKEITAVSVDREIIQIQKTINLLKKR